MVSQGAQRPWRTALAWRMFFLPQAVNLLHTVYSTPYLPYGLVQYHLQLSLVANVETGTLFNLIAEGVVILSTFLLVHFFYMVRVIFNNSTTLE